MRLENEDWSQPTLQERRAIIHAAQEELAALGELLEILAGRVLTVSDRARFLARTLALFIALTAVMTYPQVLHMSRRRARPGRSADGDLGAVVGGAPAADRAGAHLRRQHFLSRAQHAGLFRDAAGARPAAAPLPWLGVGPILIYNLVFLSGFALSGVGVALLVRRLTGNAGAAILAGLVFAFPPYRIDHYAHLQLQQTQFIPLALWAFHRLLDTSRLRDGVLLGVFTACQMLSCMYYGLFLIPYMTDRLRHAADRRSRAATNTDRGARGAAAIVAVVMFPVARAYLAASKVVGERGRAEVATNSATLRNYLAPPEVNLLYGDVFARFMDPERRLFPGFVAIALAFAGLALPRRPRALATARSAGLRARPAARARRIARLQRRDLSRALRLLPAVRGAARPRAHGTDGRILARGTGRLRRGTNRRTRPLAADAARRADHPGLDAGRIRVEAAAALGGAVASAGELRGSGQGSGVGPTSPIFEFPTGSLEDPEYLYYSTFHWQYLVNGYSGFFPPSYRKVVDAVRDFPDQQSMDVIGSHGVRYLVIHGEWLTARATNSSSPTRSQGGPHGFGR